LAFKWAFTENGDRSEPVDRDIRRALLHAERSHKFFRNEYNKRSTYSFIDALLDYERSNVLLFGSTVGKRPGGWRSARELVDNNSEAPISVFEILQSAGSLLTQTFASDLTKIDDDDEDESE
jgi:hypothetical protein